MQIRRFELKEVSISGAGMSAAVQSRDGKVMCVMISDSESGNIRVTRRQFGNRTKELTRMLRHVIDEIEKIEFS